MSKLTATTLNGQMMLGKYAADIPGLKDGDILDSEDCDLMWQCRTINGDWVVIDSDTAYGLDNSGYKTRQAYILKSQPSLNEGKEE